MEDLLKELQRYQIEAFRKGISFDVIAYTYNDDPEIRVRLSYAEADKVTVDTRTYCTTFSDNADINKMKLGRIAKFINNIEKEND